VEEGGSAGLLSRSRHGLLPRERNCRMIKVVGMRTVVASRSWCWCWYWCCLRKSLERVYPKLMWPPVSLSDLGERQPQTEPQRRQEKRSPSHFFRKEPNKRAPKVSVVELKETKIEVKDLGWVFESFKIIQKGFQ
jgi:hypothetical protein